MAGAMAPSMLLLTLVVLAHPRIAAAWGKEGHEIVCDIAQGLLSPRAAQRVGQLLPSCAGGSMSAVCAWPDEIRYTHEWYWSGPLHFVDTPDNLCNYQFSRDCKRGCAVSAILNYTSQLTPNAVLEKPIPAQGGEGVPTTDAKIALPQDLPKQQTAKGADDLSVTHPLVGGSTISCPDARDYQPSVFDETVALIFLMHFMGDVHQPLHCGFTTDRGGNSIKVSWYNKAVNLHEVWDSEIIYKDARTNFRSQLLYTQYLANISATQYHTWSACSSGINCPNDYASESISLACKYAYAGVHQGDDLGDQYFAKVVGVVEQRLAMAGARLAATLNAVFGKASAGLNKA